MTCITIPGTALKPSKICLGTGDMGGGIDQRTAFAILDSCLDRGGNFLDTAKIYSDWIPNIERSISEKTIGKWMKLRHNRSRIVLATKGAHPELSAMHIGRLSRQEILSDLEASLKSLQVDCIDLYWLHRDDPDRPVEDILGTLNAAVKAGQIRYFGGSNWRPDRIRAAQDYASQHGMQGFSAIQNLWSLAVIDYQDFPDKTCVIMDDALRAYHQKTGLAAIPYSSQANGLFNKMAQGPSQKLTALQQGMYRSAENARRFERIKTLSAETSLSVTQIVLGYLLSQSFTTIPIVGCRTVEQVNDSMSATDVRLTPEQLKFLENK